MGDTSNLLKDVQTTMSTQASSTDSLVFGVPASDTDHPVKLILDLDTGIDDALALVYTLGYLTKHPNVELLGIMGSFGNVAVETGVNNTLAVLDLFGRSDVPVYVGSDRALTASEPYTPMPSSAAIHGSNGIGGAKLPISSRAPVSFPSAVEFLLEAAETYGSELVYVPTGPLTNLARALRCNPELTHLLSNVTFMGGALTVPGNTSPFAEANIACDPEAAQEVLSSNLHTTMVGLDVTERTLLRKEDTAAWRDAGTPRADFLTEICDFFFSSSAAEGQHTGGCFLHDPLAVASALNPAYLQTLPCNLMVETAGPGRGRTICDPDRLCDTSVTCQVGIGVDATAFLDDFLACVGYALRA